jgi:hypothetical protein
VTPIILEFNNLADRMFPEYKFVQRQDYYRGSSEHSLLINILSYNEPNIGEQLINLICTLNQEMLLFSKTYVDLETI